MVVVVVAVVVVVVVAVVAVVLLLLVLVLVLVLVLLLCIDYLTSKQHASVSHERSCRDKNCSCCHAEREVADQTCYLTQSQYTDTRPTSPSAEGSWQGSHWSTHV